MSVNLDHFTDKNDFNFTYNDTLGIILRVHYKMNDSLSLFNSETESLDSQGKVKHNIKILGLRVLYSYMIYHHFAQYFDILGIDEIKDITAERLPTRDPFRAYKYYETADNLQSAAPSSSQMMNYDDND